MSNPKISPAFDPLLAETGPNDKHDAIVVYRAPVAETPRLRGRLRTLRQRLDRVKARAAAQRPVQAKLFEDYQAASSKRLARNQELAAAPIGSSTLPVAALEVTRKTLPALAKQPDVVAVLPNQKIHREP
ncbi:MAG: hypothetical protein ETSY1_45840 [Candidatus Entotheonella factor]|uniref:Uncharacterized protein n=1 Tax=Entotheonella factor TaxID=1429438 RepID=W4L1R8_ENTF1|nr:MAG: hypothetical protein ETSY1_45840 [Candidatus Entotheonella factor]